MIGESHLLTLWVAVTVALGPFSCAYKIAAKMYGNDTPPGGCLALVGVPLPAAPFIGYWFYHTFAVVLRP